MRLIHAHTALELHELSRRDGPALLLLHALGGSSADWSEAPPLWPGRVYALDFSGHGDSDWVRGGVYLAELLAADADVALSEIGAAALAGAGIGAYVALLLAAGRRASVPAALLLPGRGLFGGSAAPDFDRPPLRASGLSAALPPGCDPLLGALERDTRPPDYAARFAAGARRLLLLDDGSARPPWWESARQAAAAESIIGDVSGALQRLAELM